MSRVPTDDEWAAMVAEKVRSSTAAQGLPLRLEDGDVLDRVARVIEAPAVRDPRS